MGESPQYGQPIILDSRSFDDGVELEMSQDSNGRQTVSRLQRMLQETDDRLEKLQSEVGEVTLPSGNVQTIRMNNVSEESSEESDSDFEEDSLGKIRHIWMPKSVEASTAAADQDVEAGAEPRKKPSTLFSLSPFGKFTPKVNADAEADPRFDEAVVRLLTPAVVEALRQKLGLPPGLRIHLELEVARLQLGASLFHHSTVKCDRGCEGNDEESEISSSDDDDDDDDLDSTTSWDDSLSEPSSNENEEDSSSFSEDSNDGDLVPEIVYNVPRTNDDNNDEEHEPSVPERPRILSSSSSSSSVDSFSAKLSRMTMETSAAAASGIVPNERGDHAFASGSGARAIATNPSTSSPTSFFSFGGSDEHQTIMNYVQNKVQETFDHSTDSETD